jgi:HK97 family phage prohead protease
MSQTLLIEGHASLFDLPDLGGDIVRSGAFLDSLAARRSIPMLFQHDPAEPVGVWTGLGEDQRGLFVRGEMSPDGPRGQTAMRLVQRGSVDGLSIGFRTHRSATRASGGRDLLSIDLWEVSIVTFPMLPQARLRMVAPTALAA